jgi:hypothetical protein
MSLQPVRLYKTRAELDAKKEVSMVASRWFLVNKRRRYQKAMMEISPKKVDVSSMVVLEIPRVLKKKASE